MNIEQIIEEKINAMYPSMKKNANISVKNMMGTPRANMKMLGKSNMYVRKLGKVNQ